MPLQRAIKDRSIENFSFEVIKTVEYFDTYNLLITERCYMDKYDSINNRYNSINNGLSMICKQPELQSELVQIDTLRSDGVPISAVTKKIGIQEFCRPSDSFSDQLLAAYDCKNLKYAIVERALHQYVAAGWQVKVLPWVVGIRGLVEESGIHAAVEYLNISRNEGLLLYLALLMRLSNHLPSCTE